jgi:hypothetical protein
MDERDGLLGAKAVESGKRSHAVNPGVFTCRYDEAENE